MTDLDYESTSVFSSSGPRFTCTHSPECVDHIMIFAERIKPYIKYQRSWVFNYMNTLSIALDNIHAIIADYYAEDPEIVDIIMMKHTHHWFQPPGESSAALQTTPAMPLIKKYPCDQSHGFRIKHYGNKLCNSTCSIDNPCYSSIILYLCNNILDNIDVFTYLLMMPNIDPIKQIDIENNDCDEHLACVRGYLYRQLKLSRE